MLKRHNVFDVFNDPDLVKPFAQLLDDLDTDAPDWLSDNATYLDQGYLYRHAPSKEISREVEIVLENGGGNNDPTGPYPDLYTLTDASVSYLMNGFYIEYGENIAKIIAAMQTQYKPLENYSMEEKTTPNLTDTNTAKSNVRTTGSNKVYGFNSATAVPVTDTQTDTATQGADTANQSVLKRTGTNTVTRSGNIGVTTSQAMLISELDLRESRCVEEMIYRFLDHILTCGAYTHGITCFKLITN